MPFAPADAVIVKVCVATFKVTVHPLLVSIAALASPAIEGPSFPAPFIITVPFERPRVTNSAKMLSTLAVGRFVFVQLIFMSPTQPVMFKAVIGVFVKLILHDAAALVMAP